MSQVIVEEKICKDCKELKPISEFYRLRSWYGSYCRSCHYIRTSKDARWRTIKSKYGLTRIEFELMLVSQDSKCAICKSKTELVVDHDHTTGKVRGLLCRRCNFVLGILEDEEFIEAANRYLEAV